MDLKWFLYEKKKMLPKFFLKKVKSVASTQLRGNKCSDSSPSHTGFCKIPLRSRSK